MIINLIWRSNVKHINTIKDYVESFCNYSKNKIIITDWNQIIPSADIIILHYSIIHAILFQHEKERFKQYIHFLSKYKGKVVVIIQDEYYDVNKIRLMLKLFNVDLILSCIPKEHQRTIYNTTPKARIESVLTGYILKNKYFEKIKTIKERNILIFYRGKNLPYYYGKLGRWKQNIGIKMKYYCDNHDIENINIAWKQKDKIFGDAWIHTMHDSKVTLATPSGLNVFHYDNKIINACNYKERYIKGYTYEMAEKEFNLQDGPIPMGQISPKMFEAAMCGTVLVMYPGTYNGIFKKNIHYIELQPDFSNIEQVMKKIQDDDYLQKMSNRTYKDIVESGKYSYKTFITKVDGWLDDI